MATVLSGGAWFSAGWQCHSRDWSSRRLGFVSRLPVLRQQRVQVAVLQRRQALEVILLCRKILQMEIALEA
jgi:hypothetical protein